MTLPKPSTPSRKALKLALASVASLACLPALGAIPIAHADQLANYRAEATELANQIYALGLKEGALGEQYDAGVIALDKANSRLATEKQRWGRAIANQHQTESILRQAAIDAYVGGGQGALDSPNPLQNDNDVLLHQELEQTFASDQSDAVDQYRLAAAEASTAYSQLLDARQTKAREVATLNRERNQVAAAEYKLEALQEQVKGNIATLVAQIERQRELAAERAEQALLAKERAQAEEAAKLEAAREAAAEEAQAAAARQAAEREAALAASRTTTTVPSTPATTIPAAATTTIPAAATTTTPAASSSDALPGENPDAPAAIAAAESRVGYPYVWGAAGPYAFDCSGLVMWAWEQVGVFLPHYSGAQYDDTIPVPMSDLEPGDLVFPADPGEHVAMYIGNGEIVQAPYTGADVQVVPLTSFFVLATRVGS